MISPILPRQRVALNAILDCLSETGSFPTSQTLLGRMGGMRSRTTAFHMMQGLRKRGVISGHGRPTVSAAACFKFYRFDREGGAFLREW